MFRLAQSGLREPLALLLHLHLLQRVNLPAPLVARAKHHAVRPLVDLVQLLKVKHRPARCGGVKRARRARGARPGGELGPSSSTPRPSSEDSSESDGIARARGRATERAFGKPRRRRRRRRRRRLLPVQAHGRVRVAVCRRRRPPGEQGRPDRRASRSAFSSESRNPSSDGSSLTRGVASPSELGVRMAMIAAMFTEAVGREAGGPTPGASASASARSSSTRLILNSAASRAPVHVLSRVSRVRASLSGDAGAALSGCLRRGVVGFVRPPRLGERVVAGRVGVPSRTLSSLLPSRRRRGGRRSGGVRASAARPSPAQGIAAPSPLSPFVASVFARFAVAAAARARSDAPTRSARGGFPLFPPPVPSSDARSRFPPAMAPAERPRASRGEDVDSTHPSAGRARSTDRDERETSGSVTRKTRE